MSVGEITSTGKQSGAGGDTKLYEITIGCAPTGFEVAGTTACHFTFIAKEKITNYSEFVQYASRKLGHGTYVNTNTPNYYLYSTNNTGYFVFGKQIYIQNDSQFNLYFKGFWENLTTNTKREFEIVTSVGTGYGLTFWWRELK